MTSFEAVNSVFEITKENNRLSISTPSNWFLKAAEELINELNKLLELRSQNEIELQIKELEERGVRIEIGTSGSNLTGFDHLKSEILAELRKVNEKDHEDMVYRTELTYGELIDKLDVKYFNGTIRYVLAPENIEIRDPN